MGFFTKPKPKPRNSGPGVPAWDVRDTDIIIAVVGPTGVGKSTFINTAVGHTVTPVGHDLQSCTKKIQPFIVPREEDSTSRIVFVDTPGFDDTNAADRTPRIIAAWVKQSYCDGRKLAGIIYLHEISQTRMDGTASQNLRIFYKSCGKDAFKSLILVTTKWDGVEGDMGRRREQQLSDTYWKKLLSPGQGSKMARFARTHESAWEIINLVLGQL